MKGQRISVVNLAAERHGEFAISGRPSGVYLVRVTTENNSGTARIIKFD